MTIVSPLNCRVHKRLSHEAHNLAYAGSIPFTRSNRCFSITYAYNNRLEFGSGKVCGKSSSEIRRYSWMSKRIVFPPYELDKGTANICSCHSRTFH